MSILKNKRIYHKRGTSFKLTSEPFITDVSVFYNKELVNSGKAKCYVYGRIKEGQFVSTYYLYGIGFATNVEEIGFAKSLVNKETPGIGEIEIEFLPRFNAKSNEVTIWKE